MIRSRVDQHLRPRHDRRRCSWSCWSPSSSPVRGSRSWRWASSTRSCARSAATTTGSRRSCVIEDSDPVLPTRVHAIVLVSKLHKPTMRALAYAKASRPNILEAVFVDVDGRLEQQAGRRVGRAADRRTAEAALLAVPRDHPADRQYATEIREANPRGVVAVYIPEYVVGPLVGAAAAQPDGAAAQGPAAVHARRDGDLGALPAAGLGEGQGAVTTGSCDRLRPGDVRRGRTRSGR